MNTVERKIGLRVLGIHATIIFLMVLIPAMRGCFKPKTKEIVTFIDFGEPAPKINVEQVARLPDPTPPKVSKPAEIPEPPKTKPPKPKPKPKVEKPKPKWKPVDPKDIKIGQRVNKTSAKPTLSDRDIKKALSGINTSSRSKANPSRFNNYYARVMTLFYNHWKPPASATSATDSAVVRISMRRNGLITKRLKTKSSSDPLYDRTVMDAVNAVSTLPRPPSDYPYDYVEVVFTLDN